MAIQVVEGYKIRKKSIGRWLLAGNLNDLSFRLNLMIEIDKISILIKFKDLNYKLV